MLFEFLVVVIFFFEKKVSKSYQIQIRWI